MDPVTQGLLGAAAAQLVARKHEARAAAFAGALAGCAADLDILLPSGGDPLGMLAHHRHFTHALIFVPAGALVVALVAQLLLRGKLPLLRVYLFCLLGYATHGPLDALTTYGTHLLWPFSDEALATGTVAVLDPLYTLVLAGLVAAGAVRRARAWAIAAAVWSACYFGAGFVQKARAGEAAEALARSRGHKRERALVKTTMGNLILWRSLYAYQGRFYADAIRAGLDVETIPGESIAAFARDRDAPNLPPDSQLGQDLERFATFSQGWVALHPNEDNLLGDMRFSALPTSLVPLWGVRFSPVRPDSRVEWVDLERMSPETRARFQTLLLGD